MIGDDDYDEEDYDYYDDAGQASFKHNWSLNASNILHILQQRESSLPRMIQTCLYVEQSFQHLRSNLEMLVTMKPNPDFILGLI